MQAYRRIYPEFAWVKAYVREDYETSKFQKACNKVYEMFVRAEKLVVMNMPLMQFTVYACILCISWLGAKMIVGSSLTTGELMSLLTYCMNILMSSDDAVYGICYGDYEYGQCRACDRSY